MSEFDLFDLVIVEFPGRPAVRLKGLSELDDEEP